MRLDEARCVQDGGAATNGGATDGDAGGGVLGICHHGVDCNVAGGAQVSGELVGLQVALDVEVRYRARDGALEMGVAVESDGKRRAAGFSVALISDGIQYTVEFAEVPRVRGDGEFGQWIAVGDAEGACHRERRRGCMRVKLLDGDGFVGAAIVGAQGAGEGHVAQRAGTADALGSKFQVCLHHDRTRDVSVVAAPLHVHWAVHGGVQAKVGVLLWLGDFVHGAKGDVGHANVHVGVRTLGRTDGWRTGRGRSGIGDLGRGVYGFLRADDGGGLRRSAGGDLSKPVVDAHVTGDCTACRKVKGNGVEEQLGGRNLDLCLAINAGDVDVLVAITHAVQLGSACHKVSLGAVRTGRKGLRIFLVAAGMATLPEVRLRLCLRRRNGAGVARDIQIHDAGNKTRKSTKDRDLRNLKAPLDLHVPYGIIKVLHAGVGVEVRRLAGVEADLLNGDELAAKFSLQMQA